MDGEIWRWMNRDRKMGARRETATHIYVFGCIHTSIYIISYTLCIFIFNLNYTTKAEHAHDEVVAQHNAWRREAQKREALLEENNSSKN
jgi:hypothetical protein